jgi:hypothetical protein
LATTFQRTAKAWRAKDYTFETIFTVVITVASHLALFAFYPENDEKKGRDATTHIPATAL